jgi:hypothetical protein
MFAAAIAVFYGVDESPSRYGIERRNFEPAIPAVATMTA